MTGIYNCEISAAHFDTLWEDVSVGDAASLVFALNAKKYLRAAACMWKEPIPGQYDDDQQIKIVEQPSGDNGNKPPLSVVQCEVSCAHRIDLKPAIAG